ncbi:hypothetical protein A2U01_0101242, partial [Trifolium medium]|nr:hypothetical protein [Trifolium medium]
MEENLFHRLPRQLVPRREAVRLET